MNPKENNIVDYAGIIKRRKNYVLIPFIVIFLIFTVVAFTLPPVYKSSCTILVEGQQIPPDFVRSTVTSFAEQTIQLITQQIQSRNKLLEIINQLNLYADIRGKKTVEEIIEKMRNSIGLKMISTKMAGSQNDKSASAAIAFSLSYEGKDPEKVQRVTNILSSLYMEENLRVREEKVKTISAFIEAELKNANESVTQLETKIAQFKEKHLLDLPEMKQTNMQMMQSLERELDHVEQQIQSVEERNIYLQGLLATVDPYLAGTSGTPDSAVATTKQKLAALYADYLTMEGTLSEKHPDMIRMKKQIQALEEKVSFKDSLELKQRKLKELQAELTAKKDSLSSDQKSNQKDISRLKKAIALLQDDITQTIKETDAPQKIIQDQKNPAYITIATQVETTQMELASLKKDKIALQEKILDYQKRLEMAPQVELEYKLLTRDYDAARARYQESLDNLMKARAAETLERDQKAEKFTILDAAFYPEKPFKPNRLAIILVGFILALGTGAGCAAMKEFTDRAIYSESSLAAITHKPALAIISYIEAAADRRKRRTRRIAFAGAVLVTLLLGTLAVHLFVMPLDILWFKALRYGSRLISVISL
ncbi:MAG: hypothetical protein AB1847_22965 [bacterium]